MLLLLLKLLGPIKVVAKSMNCNYNGEFPKVSVVILNFFPYKFGSVAGVLYNLVPWLSGVGVPLGMYPLYCNFCGVVSAR